MQLNDNKAVPSIRGVGTVRVPHRWRCGEGRKKREDQEEEEGEKKWVKEDEQWRVKLSVGQYNIIYHFM